MMADGPVAYTIVTAAAVSADAAYNGLNPADVAVNNLDDETVAAPPPFFGGGGGGGGGSPVGTGTGTGTSPGTGTGTGTGTASGTGTGTGTGTGSGTGTGTGSGTGTDTGTGTDSGTGTGTGAGSGSGSGAVPSAVSAFVSGDGVTVDTTTGKVTFAPPGVAVLVAGIVADLNGSGNGNDFAVAVRVPGVRGVVFLFVDTSTLSPYAALGDFDNDGAAEAAVQVPAVSAARGAPATAVFFFDPGEPDPARRVIRLA
jgi:hypothetical protein